MKDYMHQIIIIGMLLAGMGYAVYVKKNQTTPTTPGKEGWSQQNWSEDWKQPQPQPMPQTPPQNKPELMPETTPPPQPKPTPPQNKPLRREWSPNC